MSQYMLMFSLGPVQPFIEKARKTRDLWLGSLLLSKLMEEAMKDLEVELGAEFVFPSNRKINSEADKEYANLPNKYIAIFDDAGTAENAAIRSKEQIFVFWNELRADIKSKIVQWYADEETDRIWDRQSNPNTCFEVRWVIVEGVRDRYAEWLEATEGALEARKRLHNFQQSKEPGEKSTISGERQALSWAIGSGTMSERQQVRAFWETLANRKDHPPALSAKEISLDGSERLDAIDTIKRFATRSTKIGKRSFPSTSSIAVASFVEGLLKADLNESNLRVWREATGPLEDIAISATDTIPKLKQIADEKNWILRRDGDCYFRATFTQYRLKIDYGVKNEDEANGIAINGKKGLEQLLKAAGDQEIRAPTPYYAILKMDGDRMGKLLSTTGSPKDHKEISGALSKFTRHDAPDIVNDRYPGRLIYAGGDDVLALAPLARNFPKEGVNEPDAIKTVIDLSDHLQRQYQTRIDRGATASISIAIAHHYTPLSFVLEVMRRAERQLAKKRYGRNALVVSVIRRSGAQTQVGCRWEYKQLKEQPDAQQPMRLFSRFYELFAQDILSPKCVYILLKEAPVLVNLKQDAQASEIRRVLLRQLPSQRKELYADEMHRLAAQLVCLANAMNEEHGFAKMSAQLEDDGPRDGLIEVLGWLLVMVFLTRREED